MIRDIFYGIWVSIQRQINELKLEIETQDMDALLPKGFLFLWVFVGMPLSYFQFYTFSPDNSIVEAVLWFFLAVVSFGFAIAFGMGLVLLIVIAIVVLLYGRIVQWQRMGEQYRERIRRQRERDEARAAVNVTHVEKVANPPKTKKEKEVPLIDRLVKEE